MKVMGYDVTIDIDGVDSVVELDDLYPTVDDWHSATELALHMARHYYPDATNISFVKCGEFEMEEYKDYGYIHPAPVALQ